jgi:hypothetical protein
VALYGQALPKYYLLSRRMELSALPEGLAGVLLSPSRGLLVYVPVLLWIGWALLRYRRHLPLRRLIPVALATIAAHVLANASWSVWWGGYSYGPRLMTCLVPWFALLGMAALYARREAAAAYSGPGWRVRLEAACGLALLLLSIGMHGAGALCVDVTLWNALPVSIEQQRQRLWDWRQAQFLAALGWPPPWRYPVLLTGRRVHLGQAAAQPYLWRGWSAPIGQVRWTTRRQAELLFALPEVRPLELHLRLQPYRRGHQRLHLYLNGQPIARLVLQRPAPQDLTVPLPVELLRGRNTLRLQLPDAATPGPAEGRQGAEQWGAAVWWLELRQPSGASGPEGEGS